MTAPGLISPGAAYPLADPIAAPAGLRVIGLDLSITSTGVCLPDGTTYRIKTRAADADRRLLHIRDPVADDLAEHRPHLVVVEDLPTKMHATALKIIGKLHGVVVGALLDADVPYAYISPATLKQFAADHGSADKARMAAAAYLAVGAEFADDKGGDQCDAWWLRAAGHDACGAPLFDMPTAQRDRLSVVEWPVELRQRRSSGAVA
ncbi:crossover junction endodeoxyribonuclease RuvC [Streptomyces boncukensis]|uniref:Crossover junction endodeoxyribonuclease RuvC n=1 Tax=Streptomyces boncukensis TaxID=2711219 RepID=A0A6G4WS39_9ACTN|nr:crossover junction endodeoxyribonuclease RuvC [Streptomyces boncukensis]NGO68015.1 crossover junction endodeoxyribonuclease RuvC [Streptomyces boncukensis]